MKCSSVGIFVFWTAFGFAATANADHNTPVPFIGPTPPFKFLPDSIAFENKGPLFPGGADIVVGWTFTDDEDDDHPWVSSSPTVTISESNNSSGNHFYVYHGSVLNLRDSISASTFQGVHISGQSTAEIINCDGDRLGVNATGQSRVSVTNTTMSSAFATDDATVTIDAGTNKGMGTNGHGKITMTNGSSSGATALGGVITMENVSGIEELIAEDGLMVSRAKNSGT